MKKIAIVVALGLILGGCTSEEKKGPDKIVDAFFAQFEPNANQAIDQLFRSSPWMDENNESIINLKKRLLETVSGLGNYNGFEFINSHAAGDSESLIVYSYLVKYDKQPLRFQFVFYKPKAEWVVYSFQYDAELDTELIESSKLYFLNKTFNYDKE